MTTAAQIMADVVVRDLLPSGEGGPKGRMRDLQA